jgi:hypothetical protein
MNAEPRPVQSITARFSTKHSVSRIPSRRRPGGGNGFSRSRDAAQMKMFEEKERYEDFFAVARVV